MQIKRGNDIHIVWSLLWDDKRIIPLDDAVNLIVKVVNQNTFAAVKHTMLIQDNQVQISILADDIKHFGKYRLEISWQFSDSTSSNGFSSYSADCHDAFEITPFGVAYMPGRKFEINKTSVLYFGYKSNNVGGEGITPEQAAWIGEGIELINGAESLPEGINLNAEELKKKAPKEHTHNYAPYNHTHNYAPADHSHDYSPSNHDHNSDYAPKSHTHTDLLKKPDTDGTAGQVLTITEAGLQWKTPSSTGGGESIPGSGLTEEQKAFLGASGDLQTEAKDSLPKAINEVSNKVESLGQEVEIINDAQEEGIINLPYKVSCFGCPTQLGRVPLVLERNQGYPCNLALLDENTGIIEYIPKEFNILNAGGLSGYKYYVDETEQYIFGYQNQPYRYNKLTGEVIKSGSVIGHYKQLFVVSDTHILIADSSSAYILDYDLNLLSTIPLQISRIRRAKSKIIYSNNQGTIWFDFNNGDPVELYQFVVGANDIYFREAEEEKLRCIGNNTIELALLNKDNPTIDVCKSVKYEGLYGGNRYVNDYFFCRYMGGAGVIIRYDLTMGYYSSGFTSFIRKLVNKNDYRCIGGGNKLALWVDTNFKLHYLKPY